VSNCAAITGGAFVPDGVWPAAYNNQYLFADYVCGSVFQMSASAPYPGTPAPGTNALTFGTSYGGVTNLRFGPFGATQALYYTTYGGSGQVRRIIHNFPRAVLAANPTTGPIGMTVSFNGTGSSDPNGQALTYLWDFNGDGTTDQTTSVATTTFQYTVAGTYNAALRVRNTSAQVSDPAIVVIEVGGAPTVTISEPLTTDRFRVSQIVNMRGHAVDNTGAPIPMASLLWTVLLHHDTHTHPFLLQGAGASCPPPNQTDSCRSVTTPAPEDLPAAANSYLEVQLQATDGFGLVRTSSRDLLPNRVTLNITTDPPVTPVTLNGLDYPSPSAVVSWEGYVVNASVPTPLPQPNGQTYVFTGWTDGSSANPRAITTPAAAAAFTARYVDDGTHKRRFNTVTPCRVIDTRGTAGVPIGGPVLSSGATRTFTLTGQCGVPAGVRAVAANITVVTPSQAGDLRLFPVGGTGNTSAINFRAGLTRANNAVVSLSASGQFSLTCAMAAAGTTHFLLDVVGYYQ
jgi:PKD repeat protein